MHTAVKLRYCGNYHDNKDKTCGITMETGTVNAVTPRTREKEVQISPQ